jgi:hypothetical protein
MSLVSSNALATAGGFLIIVWGFNADNDWTMPLLILMTKFGISATFNYVYLGNALLFPTLFTMTSMGFCNIGARIATIPAPIVAEIEGYTPMYILTGISLMSTIATFFMVKPPKNM